MTNILQKIKSIRCKEIPIKRFFLPFVGIIFLTFIEEVREMYYLPIVVFVSCFVLFWNFPKLVILPTLRPIYIDDLFINKSRDSTSVGIPVMMKNKYHTIYVWSLIVTSSILIAGLSDYCLTKVDPEDTIIASIGTVGGIFSIYFMVNKIIAKVILFFMKRNIEKQKITYKKHFKERIQMLSLVNDEFKHLSSDCDNAYDILNKINNKKKNDLTEVLIENPYYVRI